MNEEAWHQKLLDTLRKFGASVGTIHRYNPKDQHLYLVAHEGLPPEVLAADRYVPIGKGIGGTAAVNKKPVVLSNLQTDSSGVVRPKAKNTGAKGAICIPILENNELVGTLGIAFMKEHNFTQEEINLITETGQTLIKDLNQFPFFKP